MTATVTRGMPEIADIIIDRLDALGLAILDIHHAGKALPHPFDVIGQAASSLAHDFLATAFVVKRNVEQIETGGAPTEVDLIALEHRFENLLDIARALPPAHATITTAVHRLLIEFRSDESRLHRYLEST